MYRHSISTIMIAALFILHSITAAYATGASKDSSLDQILNAFPKNQFVTNPETGVQEFEFAIGPYHYGFRLRETSGGSSCEIFARPLNGREKAGVIVDSGCDGVADAGDQEVYRHSLSVIKMFVVPTQRYMTLDTRGRNIDASSFTNMSYLALGVILEYMGKTSAVTEKSNTLKLVVTGPSLVIGFHAEKQQSHYSKCTFIDQFYKGDAQHEQSMIDVGCNGTVDRVRVDKGPEKPARSPTFARNYYSALVDMREFVIAAEKAFPRR